MIPDSWRMDGWPLCPVCGENKLAADVIPNMTIYENEMPSLCDLLIAVDLFCYRCGRVTVRAGEGSMGKPQEPPK
jgi:hypothetical protein